MTIPSPSNPFQNDAGDIFVLPGDKSLAFQQIGLKSALIIIPHPGKSVLMRFMPTRKMFHIFDEGIKVLLTCK